MYYQRVEADIADLKTSMKRAGVNMSEVVGGHWVIRELMINLVEVSISHTKTFVHMLPCKAADSRVKTLHSNIDLVTDSSA